jgi:4-hydroxybenzoate polyprenyltransferase
VKLLSLTARIGELSPYLRLLRPELYYMDLTLPASSAILASYIATEGLPGFLPFMIAVIGGFAAITSSYVFNDCCDVDIDTINLPNRPLPSSRVSKSSALIYAFLLLLIAGAAAAYLNPESLLILFIAAGTITIYSIFAKRNTFLSFLPVGISYGLVPIGVWLAFDPAGLFKGGEGVILPLPAICFGLMMCVTDWAFTLGGVARDVEGDRLKGAPTMPVTFGIPFTAKFVTFWWIVGVIASVIIGWSAQLGPVYFTGALASGLWMLIQCLDFIKRPTPERGGSLFLNGSNYRAIMFGSMILDVVLCIYSGAYTSILW